MSDRHPTSVAVSSYIIDMDQSTWRLGSASLITCDTSDWPQIVERSALRFVDDATAVCGVDFALAVATNVSAVYCSAAYGPHFHVTVLVGQLEDQIRYQGQLSENMERA